MKRAFVNIVLALVLIPTASAGLLLTRHALADAPPDIHTAESIPIGSSAWSMQSDGKDRTFRVYVPANLETNTPVPMVVMLHGGFGSGNQAEKAYNWDQLADKEGFVVLYPDGLRRTWNAGECCGFASKKNIDDVGFILDVIDAVSERIAIDQTRVYATGISNGGMMSYRLACETDRFAAIAPVAATIQVDCADPAPISVLHIHGLEDPLVRFDGEPGEGAANVDGPSVPEVMATWRAIDACGVPTSESEGVVTTEISSCAGGRTVELITVADAGHQWPGSIAKFTGSTVTRDNYPSDAMDATETIWQFFVAQSAA